MLFIFRQLKPYDIQFPISKVLQDILKNAKILRYLLLAKKMQNIFIISKTCINVNNYTRVNYNKDIVF